MAIKAQLSLTHQDKRLMIAAGFLALLALALFLSLPALVDTKAIQNELKSTFKQATGLDLEIQDGIEVSVLPTPHVKMKNLYISNVPGAATSFLLSMRSLDMKLRPTSLLSSHPTADSIIADGVVVELERMKNGRMNWQEMAHYVAASSDHSASNSNDAPTTPSDENIGNLSVVVAALSKVSNLTISSAEVHFTDSQFGVVSDYSDIGLKFTNDAKNNASTINATINYGDLPLRLSAELEEIGQAFAKKTTKSKIRFESDLTSLNYEGDIGYNDNLQLKGKTVFESKNITRWIKLLNGADVSGSEKAAAAQKAVPLKLESDVDSEGAKILFPAITVGGGVFKGQLEATLKMPVTWDIKGTFDTIDLDTVLDSGMFLPNKSSKKDKDEKDDNAPASLNMVSKKSLWNYLSFSVDAKANNIDYNHSHITNGHLEFDMSDGDMAISQASARFPGDSRLLFTGLGKEGYQGFMIDGQLDGSGENFIDMASMFRDNGAAVSLPVDFKRFRFKTNMVLSSKELRFTELTSRVENMAFVGGIITTFGDKVKIQTAMRIGGIDLDHFYSLWGGEKMRQKLTTENTATVKTDDDITLWLRAVDYELDMRASLEKFTLNGQIRDKAKFRVGAVKNKITFTEVEMTYNDTQFAGRGFLDVTDNQPFVDMDITADTMDVSSYMGQENWLFDAPDANTLKNGGRNWSHKGFNFSWLETMNSSFRFRLGQLKNGNFEATSIDMKGGLDNRTLSLSSFNAVMQNAQVSGKGFIKGGKIPSVNFAGDITGFDVINMVGVLPALQGMSGKYNAHFHFLTSGIDVYTWLYNMDGNVSIAARDVTVDGFNLPGIVSAVGYVRTVADILDAVKRAFPGGSTVFSNIEGEWAMGSGVIRTPALKLRNELAEGMFSGEVDIINWKMVGHIAFALVYLDRVTPPKMAINYTGSLDNIEKELDTRLLEQYVANKTSEKLLHQ